MQRSMIEEVQEVQPRLQLENTLASGYLPELGGFYQGKVRDNHTIGDKRILVATDRISVFDRVLDTLIPQKGAVLNAIAMWFFSSTEDILKNHVIDWPDPNVIVGVECKRYPLEIVVRGYLTGSAWQDYSGGRFEQRYGFRITQDMVEGKIEKNCRFKEPIVTPTTKAVEGHDLPLTEEEAREIVGDAYDKLKERSLALYQRGVEITAEVGLILVDTKYEFGDLDGELILIDEVNTPDSSRYWYADEYEPGEEMEELSKQFVRDIVVGHRSPVTSLTNEQVKETSRRYIELYERLTGDRWEVNELPVQQRMLNNLIKKGYIKGGFVQIIAGSEKDDWFAEELKSELEEKKIPYSREVYSAHKNTKELLKFIELLNRSAEPLVVITVAGGSDALSGMVAHHVRFPVIACPPYKDNLDYMVNIHSILQMPGNTPALVTRRPGNAVLAAERILSLNNPYFGQGGSTWQSD